MIVEGFTIKKAREVVTGGGEVETGQGHCPEIHGKKSMGKWRQMETGGDRLV